MKRRRSYAGGAAASKVPRGTRRRRALGGARVGASIGSRMLDMDFIWLGGRTLTCCNIIGRLNRRTDRLCYCKKKRFDAADAADHLLFGSVATPARRVTHAPRLKIPASRRPASPRHRFSFSYVLLSASILKRARESEHRRVLVPRFTSATYAPLQLNATGSNNDPPFVRRISLHCPVHSTAVRQK